MPPLLRASVGWHVAAAGLAAGLPESVPWALGGVAANHALLTAAGLWPRSTWLGPNVRRLPDEAAARGEWALTIDDGPEPTLTPQVLGLLDRYGVRATFFCIAEQARTHPGLLREIVARGHDVQNHSWHHFRSFSLRGPRGLAREVSEAQELLGALSGRVPTCFRAPAGLRNPLLDPVLHRHGLHLVSWTRRGFDTREREPQRVFDRLVRGFAAGDILLLHDGHSARTAAGDAVALSVLPALLEQAQGLGLRAVTLAEALPPRHEPPAPQPAPAL